MTKNNNLLTRHEELRLDYLHKNIHYLNDKERRELDYLLAKRDSGYVPQDVQPSRKVVPKAPERVQVADDSYDSASSEDDFLLPEYPSSRSRKERLRKQAKAPKPEPIPAPKSPKPRPARKRNWFKRISLGILTLFAVTIVGMIFMFIKGVNSVEQKPVPEVFNGVDTANGTNILILGTDGRAGETSGETRTDSIMVLNVNNSDNTVKLVSFMRDILVDIEGYDYKLNTAYSLGEQEDQQGAEEVRIALKNNFDIDIKYYAMIDFSTFTQTVDTMFPEGVEINAQFSTVNGEVVSAVDVPDDLGFASGGSPYQTIQVGPQRMDGKTLLNYARFRSDDEGDFGRTRRQQEVLAALISQAKNPMKLFSGAEALGQVYAMTPTTVPQSFMWLQGTGILLDAAKGIERSTVPEIYDWVEDYDIYGGLGLRIDFAKYQDQLAQLGLR